MLLSVQKPTLTDEAASRRNPCPGVDLGLEKKMGVILETKCPQCGHVGATQAESHPADTYFTFYCNGCDASFSLKNGKPVLMTEKDWAAIYAAREAYEG